MGIIPLREREAFINRKRYDYRQYKNLTDKEIEERMLALPVKPPIFYRLTRPQKVAFIIGAETHKFCLFLDTGVGKTIITIALMRYFRRLGIIKRALYANDPYRR